MTMLFGLSVGGVYGFSSSPFAFVIAQILLGAVGVFLIHKGAKVLPRWQLPLGLCFAGWGTLVFIRLLYSSEGQSIIAGPTKERILFRVIAISLIVLGIALIVVHFLSSTLSNHAA